MGGLPSSCDTRAGGFELLLLPVLHAARVPRYCAERGLAALGAGWSEPEALLEAPEAELLQATRV